MKNLKNRTAVVTGASRGIGPHIARALAKEEMNLVLAARSREGLERTAAEIEAEYGVRTLVVPTDVTDAAARGALLQAAEREFGGTFGGIEVLVNNAGVGHMGAFSEQERG